MKAPKQTREERIRILENIAQILNNRLKQLESIIYENEEE
jgi:predicted nuclease of restriction endonuclease-like RecB superfamily